MIFNVQFFVAYHISGIARYPNIRLKTQQTRVSNSLAATLAVPNDSKKERFVISSQSAFVWRTM